MPQAVNSINVKDQVLEEEKPKEEAEAPKTESKVEETKAVEKVAAVAEKAPKKEDEKLAEDNKGEVKPDEKANENVAKKDKDPKV